MPERAVFKAIDRQACPFVGVLGGQFFINAEPVPVQPEDMAILQCLADHRRLDSVAGLSEEGLALLYDWYCCGFAYASKTLME